MQIANLCVDYFCHPIHTCLLFMKPSIRLLLPFSIQWISDYSSITGNKLADSSQGSHYHHCILGSVIRYSPPTNEWVVQVHKRRKASRNLQQVMNY